MNTDCGVTKCDREDHGRLRHVHKFKNFRALPSNLRITVNFTRIHVHQSQFDRERGCDKHYEIFRETHVIMELILCMFHYVKFIILCFCFSVLSPSRCNWNFGTTHHFSHAYTCAALSIQCFSVLRIVCVCALASWYLHFLWRLVS